MTAPLKRRGDYGFDAPTVPLVFGVVSCVALALGVRAIAHGNGTMALLWLANFAWFGFSASSFVFTTRRGKLTVWRELLDELQLQGHERLLDIGCGRGAVLLLAAEKLPRGRAVGVDLWSTEDQSGNAEAVTLRNAELEGVRDRVELHTGDMRKLPFADASFDAIVSSLAIHNIPDAKGRELACRELWRVLKPGGRALVADFRFTKNYATHLQAQGAKVTQRNLGWRFWYGGPHAATSLVTVQK